MFLRFQRPILRILTAKIALQTKGELGQERKEKCEATQAAFQKLLSNTAIFAVSTEKSAGKMETFCDSLVERVQCDKRGQKALFDLAMSNHRVSLQDLLDEDMPDLPEDGEYTRFSLLTLTDCCICVLFGKLWTHTSTACCFPEKTEDDELMAFDVFNSLKSEVRNAWTDLY